MKAITKTLLQTKNKTVPILTFPSAQLLGISVKELISSADMQAKGMEAIADRCPIGAALNMMDLSVEAEAFGAKIRIYEDEIPAVESGIIDDICDAENIVMAAGWYCLIIFCVSTLMTHEQILTSQLPTADALMGAWNGHTIARYIVVLGGAAGILTSWNAFLAAGSRVLLSMGQSGMLPTWFTKIHPKYNTPSNAVLFIGGASMAAPFFGKQLLTWISNAASFSTVIAYCLVAVSFLVLRKNEPDMERPYKVKSGRLVGTIAVVLSLGMMLLYLPGMPSGLDMPEWIIVAIWTVLGFGMHIAARNWESKR